MTRDVINIPQVNRISPSVYQRLNELGICSKPRTNRGCRGGTRLRRPIKTVTVSKHIYNQNKQDGVNWKNLVNVKISSDIIDKYAKFGLLNAQSIKNKTELVQDIVIEKTVDVLALTETWLCKDDDAVVNDFTPTGYTFRHIPRGSRGGGVGLLYKDNFRVVSKPLPKNLKTFEMMDVLLSAEDKHHIRLLILYRLLPSKKRRITSSMFFDEFEPLLHRYCAMESGRLLVVGDINFHLDNPDDCDTRRFTELLDCLDLQQHVTESTHDCGHLLDAVISRRSDDLVQTTSVYNAGVSDHYFVIFDIIFPKPVVQKHVVSYRKIKSIDITEFSEDISRSTAITPSAISTLSEVVKNYNSSLKSVLDKHAPVIKKSVVVKHTTPWFNSDIRTAKQERHKLERQWRRTKLTVHHDMFKQQCKLVKKYISSAKREYLSKKVRDCGSDQKQLFSVLRSFEKKVKPKF